VACHDLEHALWRRGLLDEPSDLVSLAYSEIGFGSTIPMRECSVITAGQAQDAKIASVDKYASVELARKRGWMETAVIVETEKTRGAKQLFPNCFQELKT